MNIWVILGMVVLMGVVVVLPRMGWMPPRKAKSLLESGAVLIDVRSPAEFRGGSVKGAVNIPVGELCQRIREEGLLKERNLLLFCASGSRSGMAKRQLQGEGFSYVYNLGTVARARQVVAQSVQGPD